MSRIILALILMGGSYHGPMVRLSYTTASFGHVTVGKRSAPKAITLSNIGNSTLVISQITLGGKNAGDFTETNNCGADVYPGRSCVIDLTFVPSAPGTRTATLYVYDNVGGSPQMLELGA